ncbi:TPA: hypothetical protein QB621_001584 [Pasteurella multocida]|uniref:Uncharacterized protein n=1 Tax=Pasteurella multocida TaxID=747 RepID=A0AAW8V9N5_PASMD|nr:hypothetical protein [Pasteurella multocida]QDA13612.1 hypothetical protein E0Z11_00745 [Pasteurella multocida subsp. multocida]MDH7436167.1 hypothetical protein [Pasteurella multocida]MDH7440033.1 hypothetical protein [Pasteurella multocida]MDT3453502.1 hypothetical protein [Pasteurella multocida]MDY0455671.1 hypothetical protein [Pasteurella multocida]
MTNKNYEIIKQVILNDQLGNPKDLNIVVVEKNLSDIDKERIKQAILKSASNTTDVSLKELAESLCDAIHLIDSYKS